MPLLLWLLAGASSAAPCANLSQSCALAQPCCAGLRCAAGGACAPEEKVRLVEVWAAAPLGDALHAFVAAEEEVVWDGAL